LNKCDAVVDMRETTFNVMVYRVPVSAWRGASVPCWLPRHSLWWWSCPNGKSL